MGSFTYHLPPERIAQRPVTPYDSAKLLIIERTTGVLAEATFSDLPSILSSNEVLVANDTKVIAARFPARVDGAEAELFLVSEEGRGRWQCIGRPMRKFLPGTKIEISSDLTATIVGPASDGCVLVQFTASRDDQLEAIMELRGIMPIPPYIRQGISDDQDKIDYQTAFALRRGSIAAPTASLHFTPQLLRALSERGVEKHTVTLHVGIGSIRALSHQSGEVLPPSAERFEISDEVIRCLETARTRGKRVIAIGTTVTRALETFAHSEGSKREGCTDLFIHPPFSFKMVGGVITNFHQPGTSHLLLVEALLGRELLERSYEYALSHDFRFLSYGDGMLIL